MRLAAHIGVASTVLTAACTQVTLLRRPAAPDDTDDSSAGPSPHYNTAVGLPSPDVEQQQLLHAAVRDSMTEARPLLLPTSPRQAN
jgi:hypothetical protein